jgi:hypothetical protein
METCAQMKNASQRILDPDFSDTIRELERRRAAIDKKEEGEGRKTPTP